MKRMLPDPPMPPLPRRLDGQQWRPAFGLYWSPKEWRLIQRLGLMELDHALTGSQVQSILWNYRAMADDTVLRALTVGSLIGLLFGAFVL